MDSKKIFMYTAVGVLFVLVLAYLAIVVWAGIASLRVDQPSIAEPLTAVFTGVAGLIAGVAVPNVIPVAAVMALARCVGVSMLLSAATIVAFNVPVVEAPTDSVI